MHAYRTEASEAVVLGRELGRGGEGVVYEVLGSRGRVAKVFRNPAPDLGVKLAVMLRRRPPDTANYVFAWPTAILHDDNGAAAGFLMPRLELSSYRDVYHYCVMRTRRALEAERGAAFDNRDLWGICRNLARAVDATHRSGYVIGDVNDKNFLVDGQGRVAVVDCDSMQVRELGGFGVYLCRYGRPDYTPPRLQGASFTKTARTANDDAFGLATLIFKITMGGSHPYDSRSDPDNRSALATPGEKIRYEYFPYNESGRTPLGYAPSAAYAERWRRVDVMLRELFRGAFDPDYTDLRARPSAERWVEALGDVILRNPVAPLAVAPLAPTLVTAPVRPAAAPAAGLVPQQPAVAPVVAGAVSQQAMAVAASVAWAWAGQSFGWLTRWSWLALRLFWKYGVNGLMVRWAWNVSGWLTRWSWSALRFIWRDPAIGLSVSSLFFVLAVFGLFGLVALFYVAVAGIE